MGNEGAQQSVVGSDSQFKKYEIEIERQPETQVSPYRPFEITFLKNIFIELDPKSTKSIDLQALDHFYELREHPLYERIRSIFKEELEKLKQKRVSFDIMLYLLVAFHIKTPIEEKYRFLFRLYDWDKDFKLSTHDVSQTLQILFPNSVYSEDAYNEMAEEFVNEYGTNGWIKFEGFLKAIPEDQVKEFMTLKFIKGQ